MVVKNKKIIQVVCTYPPYKGGTGAVAYNFKKYLKKLFDIDSLLLTPKYKKDYKSEDKDVIFLKPWLKTGNAAFIPSVYKYMKKADVVIFHAPFFGAVEPLLWLLKFTKNPPKILVYYHQDPLIDKGLRKYVFDFYNKYIYPSLFKKADRVLGSSLDYIKNSLLTPIYKEMPDKFRAVPLGVDTERFYPVQNKNKFKKIVKKYNLKLEKPIITFVGGLGQSHYFKGVKYLIKAVSNLHKESLDFGELVLIGRGNLISEYKEYAKKLGVEDKVKILTTVTDEELNLMYNLSTVNVLPSMDTSSEVFGLVSVEAMATKTPVITSDIVGVRTVTEDGKTGFLVESGDVEALTRVVKKFVNNPELSNKMGQAAYERVHKLFTWKKSVQNLKNIIDEVCQK